MAKVGGLPVGELNQLELEFLLLLNFNLAIPIEDLEWVGNFLIRYSHDSSLKLEILSASHRNHGGDGGDGGGSSGSGGGGGGNKKSDPYFNSCGGLHDSTESQPDSSGDHSNVGRDCGKNTRDGNGRGCHRTDGYEMYLNHSISSSRTTNLCVTPPNQTSLPSLVSSTLPTSSLYPLIQSIPSTLSSLSSPSSPAPSITPSSSQSSSSLSSIPQSSRHALSQSLLSSFPNLAIQSVSSFQSHPKGTHPTPPDSPPLSHILQKSHGLEIKT